MQEQGPVLSDAELDAAEEALGVTLPPKLREFFKQNNGGRPEAGWFSITDHHDGTDLLDLFLGFGHPNPTFDIRRYANALPAYIQAGLLPIGATASSSLVCVDIRRTGHENIIYLDVADPLDKRGVKHQYKVADDIFQFVSRLHE